MENSILQSTPCQLLLWADETWAATCPIAAVTLWFWLPWAMTRALRLWPLLTGTQRYEKVVSTRNRGQGQFIDAPILAYLIETPNGRILYDVGCDYTKIATPELRRKFFEPMRPMFEYPQMSPQQRIPQYLQRLGLGVKDIDVVFLGHLHFDHAGGLCDMPGCEVHVHRDELAAAKSQLDGGVFCDEIAASDAWHLQTGDYTVATGVQAVGSPGHTAGHMSLLVELPQGRPVILCGDAADLDENLADEIAPGYCWQDDEEQALASIRKLKALARSEKADLWPNHDFAAYRRWPLFPAWRE
jgi:N-acyl homoserine lactone hydrolase